MAGVGGVAPQHDPAAVAGAPRLDLDDASVRKMDVARRVVAVRQLRATRGDEGVFALGIGGRIDFAAVQFHADLFAIGASDQRRCRRQAAKDIAQMLVDIDQPLVGVVERDGHAQAVQRFQDRKRIGSEPGQVQAGIVDG